VALQGNLDPAILYASTERIQRGVAEVLEDFGAGPGHIFNLGHGVTPGVKPDNVAVLVDTVHELSRSETRSPAEAVT
jgi:uroporphyrinogen decarboxylase